uniref:Uncharacterized protein n=1 Tax=Romanomermis culicivorax TaxID=13658 RepID=A0A915K441_ROMCU
MCVINSSQMTFKGDCRPVATMKCSRFFPMMAGFPSPESNQTNTGMMFSAKTVQNMFFREQILFPKFYLSIRMTAKPFEKFFSAIQQMRKS